MLQQMSSGTNFSALQKNLQLAYSSNLDDQRVAAENLAKILEKTSFEAISFGPLAHALCRLLPSPDIDVAANAAKARCPERRSRVVQPLRVERPRVGVPR